MNRSDLQYRNGSRPGPKRNPGRRKPQWRAFGTVFVLLLSLGSVLGAAFPAQAAATTVVTLTFDDANYNHLAAAQTMKSHGLAGTFFVPSGWVGQPGYMSVDDLKTVEGLGSEIAGHTINHPSLPSLSTDDATREVCNDRANLVAMGFKPTDFAYPFSETTAAVETIVKNCGYLSARGLGDVLSAKGTACAGCVQAESIPPADPYLTKAPEEIDRTWTLADLEKQVTDAQALGGWVQLTFHNICDGCDTGPLQLDTPTAVFDAFTAWLAAGAGPNGAGTSVKTVQQVIGGTYTLPVAGPVAPVVAPPAAGVNGVVNPSLETAGTVTVGNALPTPKCWSTAGYGTNVPTFALLAAAHTGTVAMSLSMASYANGDAKLLHTMTEAGCAPSVAPGHTYSLRAWYNSTVQTQFVLYYRTSIGAWIYGTSSPYFPASTTYSQAAWTTPPIPADVSAISFGLNLFQNGTLVTDDYALYDTVGAPSTATATRLWGQDAYGTSAAISAGTFPTPGVPVAYVATGETYQDALSGAGAAGVNKGPVLLVQRNGIPAVIAAELARLKPVRIVVLGGNLAVSDGVFASLSGVAPTTRTWGQDAYGTSAAISAGTFPTPGVPVAYVATGAAYQDALSGAGAAGVNKGPVLLVQPNGIPAVIAAELARLKPARIVVLGGNLAVSDGVFASLSGVAPTTRLWGQDAYGTSAAISAGTFPTPGIPVVYLATGATYQDALSGAGAAGVNQGPVLLVQPNGIPGVIAAELARLKPARIVILGGNLAVSDAVMAQSLALVG
ncbi:cell wall-binding repeat-containing protein [Cryobacterium zhongshanensis]|uniref:Cell wall-binding repeat-containing protein n=1 Tax=Cryobacterium zhongshanensis TaxID=2928153 RepID=A0AA41QWC9_9MICO|nr:cell wall-binding repeat-containing protein [Cryobacterium zhongshanensis]MCI4657271.1 cell wall-binding repeat-containing protein [Cryobacterium zhongshanensis]